MKILFACLLLVVTRCTLKLGAKNENILILDGLSEVNMSPMSEVSITGQLPVDEVEPVDVNKSEFELFDQEKFQGVELGHLAVVLGEFLESSEFTNLEKMEVLDDLPLLEEMPELKMFLFEELQDFEEIFEESFDELSGMDYSIIIDKLPVEPVDADFIEFLMNEIDNEESEEYIEALEYYLSEEYLGEDIENFGVLLDAFLASSEQVIQEKMEVLDELPNPEDMSKLVISFEESKSPKENIEVSLDVNSLTELPKNFLSKAIAPANRCPNFDNVCVNSQYGFLCAFYQEFYCCDQACFDYYSQFCCVKVNWCNKLLYRWDC